MPITVTVPSDTARASFAGLQAFAAAADTVSSYCVDYLDSEGHVDLDSLGRERVDHVQRTLAELDAIATIEADASMVSRAVVEYVIRTASDLARAIREALVSKGSAL